jgi:membrane protein required for colicin V production
MNIIDVVLMFTLLIFCVKGYRNGFIHELFSLLIIGLGLLASFFIYHPLSELLQEYIQNVKITRVLSFLAVFFSVTIFLIILRNSLIHLVDNLNLTGIDYVLGILIGLLKGGAICSVMLIFLKNNSILKLEGAIRESLLFPFLEKIFLFLLSLLPERFNIIIMKVLGY